LIPEVDRQWLPEFFQEEETPQCRPTLLHLRLEDLLPHPAILRQWKIPFLLLLAEEWTPHQLLLWLLCLVVLLLTLPVPRPLKPILLLLHLSDLLPEEVTHQCLLILLLLHPVVLFRCLSPKVKHLCLPILSDLQ
jgi:hypothetical protein